MAAAAAAKMVRETIGNARFYRVEGFKFPFPSVTTVLDVVSKRNLADWQRKTALSAFQSKLLERRSELAAMLASLPHKEGDFERLLREVAASAHLAPDEERDEAAGFGTRAHEVIERVMMGQPPVTGFGVFLPPELEPVVQAATKFREKCGLRMLLPDTMVYSAAHHYAGSFDALGEDKDGNLVVLDWKTSNAIHKTYAFQVAAYAKAYEELEGRKVSEGWIVHFEKRQPAYTIHRVRDLDANFQHFLSCLRLWAAMQPTHDTFEAGTRTYASRRPAKGPAAAEQPTGWLGTLDTPQPLVSTPAADLSQPVSAPAVDAFSAEAPAGYGGPDAPDSTARETGLAAA